MAGCFGNHPFDRHLEGQLNKHLSEESAFNTFAENIFDECMKIDSVLTDSSDFDIFWNEKEVGEIISAMYYGDENNTPSKEIAETILNKFISKSKDNDTNS